MGLILDALIEIMSKPSLGSVFMELAPLMAPLGIAVLVGVFLGWAWRPRWAAEIASEEKGDVGGRGEASSAAKETPLPSVDSVNNKTLVAGSSQVMENEKLVVDEEDSQHLFRLVEERDGGPVWHKMMDKSLPRMGYQAWRRDPENGPPQYRSSTVFEDATPEIVRDFFWDDEFRTKNGWDDMLLYHETLEECPRTGTMVVHWVRKFPFFCSDREYIIGRRIWESERTYYCVTKGVPNSTIPRRNKPRRVDLYYSSWCIRAVESRRGDGQKTACEVLLFHHEDMGIPWEIAKLGVRQGMWGCVRRIEPGLRAYQAACASGEPISRCAFMAQVNTKFDSKSMDLESSQETTSQSGDIIEAKKPKHWAGNIPKFILIGGAVALACNLDHGLVTKAVIFGVARRFANIGRRL
ncbi:uncharacterized protein LOC109707289 isoform X1 [Ananas comosus]|uniref:StAR-related lipid transfer protein 7, mitochondrial n=1 Tax=Ananas comosus TaxID=4615 RepID=A0A199VBW5_ANACO|nr:uncharacterized protein LOC109707289 isoform X1 [Ananas comosus]OAY74607.1 StAR-related lipid transfer protein 7, mitochondrial [Ananas comosus]